MGLSVPGVLLAAFFLLTAFFQVALAGAGPWGVDLRGRPVEHLARAGTRAVVLFFTATDCPIANRYVPEMERLAARGADGVQVWYVYPNPGDSAEAVREHRARFGIGGEVVLDTGQRLVGMVHATVTPEAAVLVPDGEGLRVVYRGRIDDRYAGLGRERPQAMHHDLEEALDAALAGRRVAAPGGSAVGCAIVPVKAALSGR